MASNKTSKEQLKLSFVPVFFFFFSEALTRRVLQPARNKSWSNVIKSKKYVLLPYLMEFFCRTLSQVLCPRILLM